MDVKNKRQWADLPGELLESIVGRLFGSDITAFLAVCTSWRSATTSGIKQIDNDDVPEIVKHPFLLRYRQGSNFSPTIKSSYCELYSPAYSNKYLVESFHKLLDDSQIHSSNYGWLLLSRGKHFFFLNPSTANIIHLPSVPSYNLLSPNREFSYNRMAFSAPPTSLDCVVFGLLDMADTSGRIFSSLLKRGHSSWIHYVGVWHSLGNKTKREFISKRFVGESCSAKLKGNRCRPTSILCEGEFKWCCSSSPVFHNRAFYCLSKYGVLGVFKLDTEKKNQRWRLINTTMHKAFRVNVFDEPYLMESSEGELISVVVGARGESIRVFKFDESINMWQNVSSLQDQVIFLSRTSCLMMHCDNLPVKGLRNTIHFPRFHGNYNIFYSLTTTKFHTFDGGYTSQDLLGTQLLLDCAWLVPEFSFSSGDELDWSSSNIHESMFEGRDSLHPNYFIRNLTLQRTGSSNRNILSGENKSCKVMEHEASSVGQAWIMLQDDGDGGSEEVSCTLIDVFGGISYPMDHLAARLRGLKIYASGYGKLLMMNIPAGDCILLDTSSMTICPLPMLQDYNDKYKTSLLYLSPQDSRLFVMIFGVVNTRVDQLVANGNEGDQNVDDKEGEEDSTQKKEDDDDYDDDDNNDDDDAQDNGEGDEEEQAMVARVNQRLEAFDNFFRSSAYVCQVGADEWSTLSFRGMKYKNVVLYNDKIYAIQTSGMELRALVEIVMQPTYDYDAVEVINPYLWTQRGSLKSKEYLVASGGELLIIQVVVDGYKKHGINVIVKIKVFKCDVKREKLEELEDLGDRAFFISNGKRCFGYCATKIGVKKNNIYLTYSGDRHVYRYDYGDNSVSSCFYCPEIGSDISLELLCSSRRL